MSTSNHSVPLPISICTIAHNEQGNLPGCIESVLGWAAQMVVLDAGSTDGTLEVIRRYAAQHPEVELVSAPNEPQLNINKMRSFKAATQPWIFYLDADERMTLELWQELQKLLVDSKLNGYLVGRKNFYFGHWLRHGGMYPEKQPRLFRAGKGVFTMKHVHETLKIEGAVGEVEQPFLHYSYKNVSQFMQKLDFYTGIQAQMWREGGMSWSLANHFKYGVLRPLLRFVQKYLVAGGLLDGFMGFFAAFMAGFSEFVAYMKVNDRD